MRANLLSRNLSFLTIGSLLSILVFSATAAENNSPVQILNDDKVKTQHFLPDFSYAGYNNGIGNIPTVKGKVIDVTKYGVIANDDIDDTQALQDALKVAHKTRGSVIVKLPKGRLIISEILKISQSNIVLRGEGSGQFGTELHFPRPLQMIDKSDKLDELREYLVKYDKRQKEVDRNIDALFSEYSWSGGLIWIQKEGTRAAAYLESKDPEITVLTQALSGNAGTRLITIADPKALKIGDVVELQWLNRSGETGSLLKEMYGDTQVKIGSHHWTFTERPVVRQKTKVQKINGDVVTISDPLLHDVSQNIPAQFAKWDHLTHVGIEDLQISFPQSPYFGHHLERGYNAIYLTSVYDGWVRDIKVHNGDSGILSYNSANVTINNIETTGDRQAHYSVHLGNVHNFLVDNLTVNNAPIHSLSVNTQSTKCVFKNAIINKAAVLDQHAGANHQNLFDNITLNIDAKRGDKGPYYPVWDGSGAGYWQPGHGRFNTTWNLKVNVRSGANRSETVDLQGLAEGPDARIIGVSGNRNFTVDYYPTPYMERINGSMEDVPSLYDYQLRLRAKP